MVCLSKPHEVNPSLPHYWPRQRRPIPKPTKVLLIEDTSDLKIVISLGLELIAGVRKVVVLYPDQDWLPVVQDQKPAAILVDTVESRYDILRTLKENVQVQHIPVIYLVDRDRPQDRRPLTQLGATEVIARPFDIIRLARTVTRLMDYPRQQTPEIFPGVSISS